MRKAWFIFFWFLLAIGSTVPLPSFSPYLTNVYNICQNCQRVDVCKSNCVLNQELVYDARTGTTPCATGGLPTQLWSNNYAGTNPINLSTTTVGLGAIGQSVGQPRFSPNGSWVIYQELISTSNFTCDNTSANPGTGFDNNVQIGDYPNFAVATQVVTVTPNIGAGSLHPSFNADQSFIGYMHNLGAGGFNPANLYGNFKTASITFPANVPTLGSTNTFTDGSPHNGYETAGYNPCNSDEMYFTSWPTWPTTRIFKFSISRQTETPLTPLNVFTEFWNTDSTCSWAASASTIGSITTYPKDIGGGVPINELTVASASSGVNWKALTQYNTPGSSDYNGQGSSTVVSKPQFAKGNSMICWTAQVNKNRVLVNSIYCGTFISGGVNLTGKLFTFGRVTITK